jgi:uncharacterized protein (DUF488 family)
MELYTIGHSNHPVDVFIRLLEEHGVTHLVDVRSTPYSRFHPQFNRTALAQVVLAYGIAYTWAGEALGGRPKDPSCYKHNTLPGKPEEYLHEVSYPEVMQRPWFDEGINNLIKLAGERTTCIMCAEKDPARCHRHHLIARYLLQQGSNVTVWHILADGSLVNAISIPGLDETSGPDQPPF